MSAAEEQIPLVHSSSSGSEQSSSGSNNVQEYSKCAVPKEVPLVFNVPSDSPESISLSSSVERPENMLLSAVADPTSECPQQVPSASNISDASNNEREENMERENGRDGDGAADEEHVDRNDDIYQRASEVANSASGSLYAFAQPLDVNAASLLPASFEPTPDSSSTSGVNQQVQVVLDAATDSLVSGGTDIDHTLDGNSDELVATADNSPESPDSDDLYCDAVFQKPKE